MSYDYFCPVTTGIYASGATYMYYGSRETSTGMSNAFVSGVTCGGTSFVMQNFTPYGMNSYGYTTGGNAMDKAKKAIEPAVVGVANATTNYMTRGGAGAMGAFLVGAGSSAGAGVTKYVYESYYKK